MKSPRALFGLGLPAALSLALLAACSTGTELDNCDPATTVTLTVGVAVSDAIDTAHCISGGDPGDLFQMTLTQQSVIKFNLTSDKFPPELSVAKPSSTPTTDDVVFFVAGKAAVAVLPAGQYVVDVQSSDNSTGAYKLTTETGSLSICNQNAGAFMFIAAGQTLNSAIETTDCQPAGIQAYYENYEVHLRGGRRSYTFTATSAIPQFNFSLSAVGAAAGTYVGGGTITTNGTATFSYTPSSSGQFVVGFAPVSIGANAVKTGSYTMTITP